MPLAEESSSAGPLACKPATATVGGSIRLARARLRDLEIPGSLS